VLFVAASRVAELDSESRCAERVRTDQWRPRARACDRIVHNVDAATVGRDRQLTRLWGGRCEAMHGARALSAGMAGAAAGKCHDVFTTA